MNIAVRNSRGFVSGRIWNWTFRSGEHGWVLSNLIRLLLVLVLNAQIL